MIPTEQSPTSGSMLIPNDQGEKTLLLIVNDKAVAEPSDNALLFAKSELTRQKANRSPAPGNISFLTFWIHLFERNKEDESKATLLPKVPESQVESEQVPQVSEVQFGKPSWEK